MKKMKIHYPQWSASDAPYQDVRPVADARSAAPHRALVEAISITAEVCGRALSPSAAEMLAGDLKDLSESLLLSALARCRMELQGPLKATDILARIEDGRPDADEAWAMMPANEEASVVWTEEMASAWGAAQPFMNAGDPANARAAFRELYAKAVLEARVKRKPPHWMPSLGSDVAGRERALRDAVEKRRLSEAHVEQLLPATSIGTEQIIAKINIKRLH